MTEKQRMVLEDEPQSAGSTTLVVLGGGPRARALAESLAGSVGPVTMVGNDVDPDRTDGTFDRLDHRIDHAQDVNAIEDSVGPVDAVVAVGTDSETLLAGYLARRELEPDVVIGTVDDPDRKAAFSDTGIEPLDISAVLATQIRERLAERTSERLRVDGHQ
jgi:Trk K+ transport system NAD-binding subunit